MVGYGVSLHRDTAMTGARVIQVGTDNMAQRQQLDEAIKRASASPPYR